MIWIWLGFITLIIFFLALDLGVFNRKAHVITISESVGWTIIWVILSFGFNVLIYYLYENHVFGIGSAIGHPLNGKEASLQFFAGYILEKTLSIDNIFIIALIFSYFRIPPIHQHRVLFWGVIGALIMRAVMITLGVSLINRFEWIIYIFGALLIATAVKMLFSRHDNLEPDKNPVVRIFKKFFPVSNDLHEEKFFIRQNGKIVFTPIFITLIVVESSDLLFAIDSIPAVFAVSQDPFIIFTSNVFAILGLRSMYFALAGVLERFRFLKMSLVFVLAYVGIKMIISHTYKIPVLVSLTIISGIFSIGFLVSIFAPKKDAKAIESPLSSYDEIVDFAGSISKQVRRIMVLLTGAIVLLVGLAMIILPGPAILVIPAGMAILGAEFLWAKKLMEQMDSSVEHLPMIGVIYQKTVKKLIARIMKSKMNNNNSKERR